MRVALLAGPFEAGRCGVGDYSVRLAESLRRIGLQVELVAMGHWGLARLPSLLRLADATEADVLHLQYPTTGFASKLGPQGLAFKVRPVVTIHEARHSHVLRKLSLYPFALRASHLIFTSEVERWFALRWAPWLADRSSVIPIGSNIEPRDSVGSRQLREIIHFGLLMPRKGLEAVLNLAALLKEQEAGVGIRIVGNEPPGVRSYLSRLRDRAEGLPVTWEGGLTEREVAARLASAAVAYLPFPDGASERRATLKAALASGLAVLTTRGPDTPSGLASAVRFCASPSEALAAIREFGASPEAVEEMGRRARIYAAQFSWDVIARSHLALYERLMAGNVSA